MIRALCTLCIYLVGATAAAAQESEVASTRPDAAAFDLQDRRAREVIWTLRCAQHVAYLRSQGKFGPPDRVGSLGHCLSLDGRAVGVFIKADSALTAVESLVALDLGTGSPYSAAIDTAGLLARSRAGDDAVSRGYEAFAAVDRQFGPVTIWPRGDSLQVWLIPLDIFGGARVRALGGERGYLYSSDGRRLARELGRLETFRTVEAAEANEVRFESSEIEVPSVSELVVANLAHEAGRPVTILTKRYATSLVGPRGRGAWVHAPRR